MLENGNKDTICMFFTAFSKPPIRYYLNHMASHIRIVKTRLSVKSKQRKITKSLTFVLRFQVSLQSQKLHVKLYTYNIKVRLRGDTVLINIPGGLRMRFHTCNKNFQVPGILLCI
jgi:hypothetical protein